MKNSAERMSDTRQRRKIAGLKEFRFWIKKEDEGFFIGILKEYETYILAHTEINKAKRKELKQSLHEKLEKHGSWDEYYEKVYQMTPKLGDAPTTEKQRKFAYVVARATKQNLPNNFIVSSRMLLGEWIFKQIEKYRLEHIYNWEEIAEDYKFKT